MMPTVTMEQAKPQELVKPPGSRSRKRPPCRASEAVDEKPVLFKKAPVPRKSRSITDLAPPLPSDSKRKRVACTKYDGDYAVAMPSKGGRVKAQQGDSSQCGQLAESKNLDSAEEDLDCDRRPIKRDTLSSEAAAQWGSILLYVDDIAEAGLLSEAEGKRLRRLARLQSEQLRIVHAACSFSSARFVRNIKEMLDDM